MKLQSKVFFIISATLITFLGCVYSITSRVVFKQVKLHEQQRALEEINRAGQQLDHIPDFLDAINADWAYWDASYNFVEDSNQAYIEENLSEFSLVNLGVDAMVFLSASGEIIFAKAINSLTHQSEEIPENLASILSVENILTSHETIESSLDGYIQYGNGVAAVSSRPILKSDGTGPSNGTLICVKVIDSEEMERLSKSTNGPIELALSDLANADLQTKIEEIDKDQVSVEMHKKDVFGHDIFSIKITLKRQAYQQARSQFKLFSLTLIGVFFVYGAVTVSALQIIVIARVKRLKNEVGYIHKNRNRDTRVITDGNDELSKLAEDINVLLDGIQESEKRLKKTNEELSLAYQSKKEFISTVTHELRTPLNAIIGTSSVLKHQNIKKDDLKLVDIIYESSETLMDLINDVLDFSKIESDKLTLENQSFGLLSILEKTTEIAAAQARDKDVDLYTELDPNLPQEIVGDSLRLQQILNNLLNNALKFTHKGFVKLEAEVIKEDEANDWIEFSVKDTGIGIPEHKIEVIFDSFSQADSSTTRKYGGSGLGLAICSKLARKMGGKLEVSSIEGEGSNFFATIPFSKSTNSKPIAKSFCRKAEDGNKQTIVLQDIPDTYNEYLVRTLTSWGVTTIVNNQDKSERANLSCIIIGLFEPEKHLIEERLSQIDTKLDQKAIYLTHKQNWEIIRNKTKSPIVTLPLSLVDLHTHIQAVCEDSVLTQEHNIESNEEPRDQFKNVDILLVEDNRMNQKVFELMTQRLGCKIVIANSGEEALHLFKNRSFEIVFMDYHMPNKNGIETTQELRERFANSRTPWIVGFSADTDEDTVHSMKQSGMNDVLSKPIKLSQLREVLFKFQSQKQA